MHLDHKHRSYTGAPDEMVCTCLRVCRQHILEVIADESIRTVADLRRTCRAGGGCGSCHEELARLLLSRRLAVELNFESSFSNAVYEPCPARLLASEIALFIKEHLDPMLRPLGCNIQIKELDEEAVLHISSVEEEMRYTLGFLIEAEFANRFGGRIELVIC